MENPTLIYCYDTYCGWCYGFSPVIKQIIEKYKNKLYIEVISGGMMTGDAAMPIEKMGPFIKTNYKRVEELTGIKFGEDFLWHINNPDKSDWVMNSEKAAIALCVFKDYFPQKAIDFAIDLQYALNYEGRDLDDDEAYKHLLAKYDIPETDFYIKLKSDAFKEMAHYEFSLCKHLRANSFPQVFLQQNDAKFYMISKGYTDYETIDLSIQNVLQDMGFNG